MKGSVVQVIINKSPVVTRRRKGTKEDPYVQIDEVITVGLDSKVVLSEIPEIFNRVIAYSSVGDQFTDRMYETEYNLGEKSFIVDYSNKIVTFHTSNIGKQFRFSYKGTGVEYVPTSSIWTKIEEGNVVETLGDIVGVVHDKIDEADEVLGELNSIKTDLINGANNANTQANYAKEQGDRVDSEISNLDALKKNLNTKIQESTTATTNANKATTNTIKAISDAIKATSDANSATGKANTAIESSVLATSKAITATENANNQANYAKNQGDYAKSVGDSNKTILKTPVVNFNVITTTYPNPELGWTVQTLDNGKFYRYENSKWSFVEQYTNTAVASLTTQVDQIQKDITQPIYQSIENYGNTFQVGKDFSGTDFNDVELVDNNIRLDGQTLVNLIGGKNFFLSSDIIHTTNPLDLNKFKPSTVYTAFIYDETGKIDRSQISTGNNDYMLAKGKLVYTFTTPSTLDLTKTVRMYVYSKDGMPFVIGDTSKINMIIVEGDYTTKPIPSHFEGLKSVAQTNSNKIEILSIGENLFDPYSVVPRLSTSKVEVGKDGSVTITGTYYCGSITKVKKNTDYYISAIRKKGNNGYGAISVYKSDGNNVGSSIKIADLSLGNYTFNSGDNEYISLLLYSGSSSGSIGTCTFKEITLVEGKTAKPYTPYKSNKTEISLSAPLRSLPNGVKDTVEIVDNKAIVTRRCGEVVLNGNENWASTLGGLTSENRPNTNQYFSTVLDGIAKPGGDAVSDRYVLGNPFSEDKTSFAVVKGGGDVNILRVADIKTPITEWKSKLKDNPFTVVYELATSTIEEIKLTQPLLYENGNVFIETGVIPLSLISHEMALNIKGQVSDNIVEIRDLKYNQNNLKDDYDTFKDVVNEQLDRKEFESKQLMHGVNIVNADVTSHADVEIQGNTLVSLGNSNLEDGKYYVLSDKKTAIKVGNFELNGVSKSQKNNGLTTTANFVGKISGSNVENPHIAKRTTSSNVIHFTSLLPPDNTMLIEMKQAEINSLKGLDNSLATTNTANGEHKCIPQQIFSFNLIEEVERTLGKIPKSTLADKVQWCKGNINKLTCNWHGYGSSHSGNKATLSIWNATAKTWSAWVSHTKSTVSRLEGGSSNVTSYIDDNGFINYLINTDASNGVIPSIINTDYVELQIELKPTAILDTRPQISATANYEGKIAGSNIENPNISKYISAPTLLLPNQFTAELPPNIPWLDYSRLEKLEGLSIGMGSSTNGNISQLLFSFNVVEEIERKMGIIPKNTLAEKILWCKDNINRLTCNWYGFGSSPTGNKANLSNWRADVSEWAVPWTNTASTIASMRPTIPGNLMRYRIDDNGYIHFLAYAEPSNETIQSAIYTDYVELQIELKTTAQLLNPNIPLYEVTKSEYDKFLVEWNESEVLSRYPRVQGVQHLTNPYVVSEGENLLPPFIDSLWIIASPVVYESIYDIEITPTANYQGLSLLNLPMLPNTTYTFSFEGTGFLQVIERKADKTAIIAPIRYATEGTYTFTTNQNTRTVDVEFRNKETLGTFTFKNPILTLGSVPKPFVPRNTSRLLTNDIKLGAIGTSKDMLYKQDGQWLFRNTIFKNLILDWSIGYTNHTSSSGYKNFYTDMVLSQSIDSADAIVTDYKGKKLPVIKFVNPTSGGFRIGADNQRVYGSISNIETGFSETYVPINDDWKAYFNGWQVKTVDGSNKPTAWKSIVDGTDVPTQTLAYVKDNKASGYTPYKLSYVLAKPTIETVTDKVEGSLVVSGDTQVNVGSGIVVREKVKPILNSGFYYVNRTTIQSSNLKNRTLKILNLYKNGVVDNKWIKVQDNTAYGKERATLQESYFDPTAEYTVTYEVLEKDKFTTNNHTSSVKYNKTLRSSHDELVNYVSDIATGTSVNTRLLVEILARLKAGDL